MNSQQEIRLSAELRNIVAGQPFTPDVDAIERRWRWRRRRNFAGRGLAVITVLSVAAVGGFALAGHGSGTAGKPAASVAAKAETVAYVRQQITAALNPSGYLIQTTQDVSIAGGPSGQVTGWTDPRTGNTMLLQGSGSARRAYWESDYFLNRQPRLELTQVNYGSHTWSTYGGAASLRDQALPLPGSVGGIYFSPAEIKQILDDGVAKIAGHPDIDGQHTVELTISTGRVQYAIYADSTTYRVVRTVSSAPARDNAPAVTIDYSWTPRSAARANIINHPQIPAGYTRVPATPRS